MPDIITGPGELAIIEFPGSKFNGEIVPALAQLVDDGIVTILDLVLVTTGDDGSVTAVEVTELDDEDAAAFDDLHGEVNGLLSDEDVELAREVMSEGSSALLIVWEDRWARRLVDPLAGSGGRLVAHDRLDAETVAAALAESES
jgi:uncharacterized membrane protein